MNISRTHSAAYVSAVFAGLALAAAFPPVRAWGLAWIAMVPLLWALREATGIRHAANLGAVAGLVFYGISLHWMTRIFGPMTVAFWCIFALWMALFAVVAWRTRAWLGAKGFLGELIWIVLISAMWTGLEYFRSEVWWLNNAWLGLGYSQVGAPALLQSCRWWGVYGLSFLVVFVNGSIYAALKGRRLLAAVGLAALGATALAGTISMRRPMAQASLPVALVQAEGADIESLAAASLKFGRDARLVVWPEYAVWVQPGQEGIYQKLLASRLKELNAVRVIGAFIYSEEGKNKSVENFAWVMDSNGGLIGRYDKLHPIPYVERHLKPNPKPAAIDTPLGRLGIQICYDLDFEDGARSMARQGAGLLVVPNIDPETWGKWQHQQHSAMAPIRAVETGLWIARAASSGYSQIIDDRGRILNSLPFGATGVLTGSVAVRPSLTPYVRWGWLWGPLCLGLTAALIAALLLGKIPGAANKPNGTDHGRP